MCVYCLHGCLLIGPGTAAVVPRGWWPAAFLPRDSLSHGCSTQQFAPQVAFRKYCKVCHPFVLGGTGGLALPSSLHACGAPGNVGWHVFQEQHVLLCLVYVQVYGSVLFRLLQRLGLRGHAHVVVWHELPAHVVHTHSRQVARPWVKTQTPSWVCLR